MKILLIAPGTAGDLDSRTAREIPYMSSGPIFAPHAVAVVAALTPREHEVRIHDEHLRGPVDRVMEEGAFDVVGISIGSNQLGRAMAIARLARARALPATLAAGGIGASLVAEQREHPFDAVFLGEAEETWPEFLEELAQRRHRPVYQRLARPEMSKVPVPRWELIKEDIAHYGNFLVQTTRGCPFDCSFCDVIYTYGRTARSKSIEQVLEEVRLLAGLGVRMIFIADDNFAAQRPYTKKLLRELVTLNNSLAAPIVFMTQLDITIARDDELLELLADCNFVEVMIGVESVDKAALKELKKSQNLKVDPLEAVRKIQSYGIGVLAHMIIGSDADDAGAFARTAEFIDRAQIVHHYCHPLMAPPGTRLWYELARQGRIVDLVNTDRMDVLTNIAPRQMSRPELFEGLAGYWEAIHQPARFYERASGFLEGIKRKPRVRRARGLGVAKQLKLLARVLWYYLFQVTPAHRKAFFGLLWKAMRRDAFLVDKVIFFFTCHVMDWTRARHDAKAARDQAAWEREHPEAVRAIVHKLPLTKSIREQAPGLVALAYGRVRRETNSREGVYQIVVQAMTDYVDRFGAGFAQLDAVEQERVEASCDRILALRATAPATPSELPQQPPPGFARDILDALDRSMRLRREPSSPVNLQME